MSSEWEILTLGQLTVNYDTKRKPVRGPDRKPGPYPYYGASGIVDFVDGYIFDGDYLLIAEDGENLRTRQTPVAFMASGKFWVNNHAHIVTGNERANTRYLQYSLLGTDISGYLTGAVMPKLTQGNMNKIELKCPPLHIQDDIVDVLGSLDDRITLLRETNTTLEVIARALFKSWFVDFDPVRAKSEGLEPEGMDAATAALFPDSFEETELGLAPKGWMVGNLAECCDRIESGGTPKRTVPEYWIGEVPWLTSGEVRSPIVFDTKEKISDLGVKDSSAKLWPQGTTVLAMYGATAGEACLLAESSTANQACCGLIPKICNRAFLFMCVRREREVLASKSSGSAQQNLNKGLVSSHKILLAPDSILKSYESVAGALLDVWIENERQAKTLTQLRDTLLPRLISGQLRLPEATAATEKFLSEVI
ncbi:restriction endonuclease subunit S [Pseudomonas protegens]|uniref:restriction endonuclease subunit S n=1 Tax=Pseudomonas protegens TaxID=380021 RepID=UPI000F4BBD74|nr:restriction endonuclease subunit S [Pseudomonas protegens]